MSNEEYETEKEKKVSSFAIHAKFARQKLKGNSGENRK